MATAISCSGGHVACEEELETLKIQRIPWFSICVSVRSAFAQFMSFVGEDPLKTEMGDADTKFMNSCVFSGDSNAHSWRFAFANAIAMRATCRSVVSDVRRTAHA